MKLVWKRSALRDLEAIGDWIARDNPTASCRVVQAIFKTADMLARFPMIGKAAPAPGHREFVLGRYPYVVVYKLVDDVVEIRAVFHARRKRR